MSVRMKKIRTMYLSNLSVECLEGLKRVYGFRSRSQLIENLAQYLWSLALVRSVKRLSPELQHKIAEQVLNELEKKGSSLLPKRVRQNEDQRED